MDAISLSNLTKVETCYKSVSGTILDKMYCLRIKQEAFRKQVLLQEALVTTTK